MSNAEIAKVLLSLAQLLSTKKENPYKIRAYRRAARTILNLADSLEELVRSGGDITSIPGIGHGIGGAIREIVERGGELNRLNTLRAEAGESAAALNEYPLLDPKRIQRIYRKLGIASVDELRARLKSGDIGAQFGERMEQHVRQGLTPSTSTLLYDAHRIVPGIEKFLLEKCGAQRVEPAGEYRRRVEVIEHLSFLVQAADLPALLESFTRYGGKTTLLRSDGVTAQFQLPSGALVELRMTTAKLWGLSLIAATGSEEHLRKLAAAGHDLAALARSSAARSEETVYRKLGLEPIPPELREGADEVERAAGKALPALVTQNQLRGDLHAHSTSSDGVHTIEEMAAAARDRGYEYLGITDHSQSLKIAGGVSEADLRTQLRLIDQLNGRSGIRILKSAEVDILPDGSLDYPDDLLKELDYTICSIHSRFSLGKTAQTERILRAMDNRYFNILGHATGRILMKRPGYALDFERIVAHARQNGCLFEINSSPYRLDLSAQHAHYAHQAGIRIAVNTDAHSTRELDYMRCGVEQARRAGLSGGDVLNCLPWPSLQRLFRR